MWKSAALTVLLGAIAGALASVAVQVTRPPAPAPAGSAAPMADRWMPGPATSKRTWAEIDQGKVDAFTKALDAIPKEQRRPVVIFCQNDVLCGDLALNLENSLESAKWTVTRETPLADQTVGVGVSDPKLLAVLKTATGLDAKPVEASLGDKVAIVIGRKPRD